MQAIEFLDGANLYETPKRNADLKILKRVVRYPVFTTNKSSVIVLAETLRLTRCPQ